MPERVPSASRMPKYIWSTARCGAIRKSSCPDKDRGGATFRTKCEGVHCGEDEEAASDQEQVNCRVRGANIGSIPERCLVDLAGYTGNRAGGTPECEPR
jgi:hypothetical protein